MTPSFATSPYSAARRAIRRFASTLWCLLALADIAHAQEGCVPVPLAPGAQGADLCYGAESWREPTLGGRWLQQAFDFYRAAPAADGLPAPLIVWAHPNGTSKWLPRDGQGYAALVAPALVAGFSFASIEFRHPVTNETEAASPDDPGVPHHDIARALQFIRANAAALGIDRRNVFFVGGSRGTLTLWTALQDDMADPDSQDPVARQSTRVNAVFGVNAQTTYDGLEFADLFIVEGERGIAKAAWRLEHEKYAQFGSALRSVDRDVPADPPVMLRYDQPFVRHQVTLEELAAMVEVHYPDYGLALCVAYARAGLGERCSAEADPRFASTAAAYDGYVDFFRQHLRGRSKPVQPAGVVTSSRSGLPAPP